MLGTKRETITRILADFSRRGWVDVHYGHIQVKDVENLKNFTAEHDE